MNKYREDLLFLATQAGFKLPYYGWAVYFYFPMPVQWTKKKRDAMAGQLHQSKPDFDNLYKIFSDALCPDDEKIAQLSGIGKFWIDAMTVDQAGNKSRGDGYIEILLNQPVHNPFGVTFIDQDVIKKQVVRKRTKRKPGYEKRQKRKPKALKIRKDIMR